MRPKVHRASRARRRAPRPLPPRALDGMETPSRPCPHGYVCGFNPLQVGGRHIRPGRHARAMASARFQSPSSRGSHIRAGRLHSRGGVVSVSIPFKSGKPYQANREVAHLIIALFQSPSSRGSHIRASPRTGGLQFPLCFNPLQVGEAISGVRLTAVRRSSSVFQSPSSRGSHIRPQRGARMQCKLFVSIPFKSGKPYQGSRPFAMSSSSGSFNPLQVGEAISGHASLPRVVARRVVSIWGFRGKANTIPGGT
jgi:hypothetical protein